MKYRLGAIALAGATMTLVFAPLPADAAAGCVGRAEYDATHRGMSVIQVSNWYDTYGDRITDGNNTQRRDYLTCWNPDGRRVIVEFSYDTGDSVDWYVRAGEGG